MSTFRLSELLRGGARPTVAEAVAIAQLLSQEPGCRSVDDVELTSDGSAISLSWDEEPSVALLAALLYDILPPNGIPTALRQLLARAMQGNDASSVEQFSEALSRFEHGDRLKQVVRFLARAGAPQPESRLIEERPQVRESPEIPDRSLILVVPPANSQHEALAQAPLPQAADVMYSQPPVAETSNRTRTRRRRAASLVVAALLLSAVAGFAGIKALGWPTPSWESEPADGTAPAEPVANKPEEVPPAAPSAAQATVGRAPAEPAITESSTESARPVPALGTRARGFSPAFSSDGMSLFFQTGGGRDGRSAIEVASARTWPASATAHPVIDDGARNYHPQPSRDGRLIAFDSDRDGERGVYIAEKDGSHVRRLSSAGYAALPTWSPDGSRIAYVRAESPKSNVWNLWIQPLNGGAARRLTRYRFGQTWAASWFPDGKRVAYSHEDTLTILDLDNGSERQVRTPIKGRLVRTPAVSPDGTHIIFQVSRSGAWMFDVDTGLTTKVLDDPTAEEFAWTPDGRRVAFHSRRDGDWGVYVLSGITGD